jgi:hypothetical protein
MAAAAPAAIPVAPPAAPVVPAVQPAIVTGRAAAQNLYDAAVVAENQARQTAYANASQQNLDAMLMAMEYRVITQVNLAQYPAADGVVIQKKTDKSFSTYYTVLRGYDDDKNPHDWWRTCIYVWLPSR